MKYDATNALGSLCYDADARPEEKIDRVISVDTRTSRVEVARYVDGHYVVNREKDGIETDFVQFTRIDTEIDVDLKIVAFHCHGRRS